VNAGPDIQAFPFAFRQTITLITVLSSVSENKENNTEIKHTRITVSQK